MCVFVSLGQTRKVVFFFSRRNKRFTLTLSQLAGDDNVFAALALEVGANRKLSRRRRLPLDLTPALCCVPLVSACDVTSTTRASVRFINHRTCV